MPRLLQKLIYPLFLPMLSAALLCLAFPPIGWFALSFIALIPLLVSLKNCGFKQGLGRGFIFGLVFWGVSLLWIDTLSMKWTGSAGLALVPWIFLSAFMSLWMGLFGGLSAVLIKYSKFPLWLSIPALWTLIEFARSYYPLGGFPWNLLGSSVYSFPLLIRPAALGGVWLLSFLILIPAAALCLYPIKSSWKVIFGCFLMTSILVFTYPLYSRIKFDAEKSNILIVQTGINQGLECPEGALSLYNEAIINAMRGSKLGQYDLVVFPESIAPVDMFAYPKWAKAIADEGGNKATVLLGAHRQFEKKYENLAAVINPDGSIGETYAKKRTVPFGEYVPFRNSLPFLNQFHLLEMDCIAGKTFHAINAGKLRVGTPICFESLYPDVSRAMAKDHARLLVYLINDDWYEMPGRKQHAMTAPIRAVETGLPVIRVTPTGISMIIQPNGVYISLPANVSQTVPVMISTTKSRTLYVKFGDWMVGFCGFLVIIGLLWRKPNQSKTS